MVQDFKSEIKLFLTVAVISAVLAVAGIFLLKGAGLGPSSPPPSPAPPPISLPQAVEESAAPRDQAELDFAGWQTPLETRFLTGQTYRNDEFGFEVKYPRNETINFPAVTVSDVSFQAYPGIRIGEFDNGCTLYVFKGPDRGEFDPFDESDVPVKERRYAVSDTRAGDDYTLHFGMAVASHAVDPESCQTLLKEILSTFRFVEQVDTSGWQTYRNPKHRYEVKYPKERIAGPTEYVLDPEIRLNFRVLESASAEEYGNALEELAQRGVYDEYSKRETRINDYEVIIHSYNSFSRFDAGQYWHEYEIKRNDGIAVFLVFSANDISEPTAGQKELFDRVAFTFRFVEKEEATQWTECVDEPEGVPVITFISPESGPVGTEIEIRGCNFSGFEGDKNAWIENVEGVKGLLFGGVEATSKVLHVTLHSSLCQVDTSYSGLPCKNRLELTPGEYKIYVMPWAQKSNEVTFTITE